MKTTTIAMVLFCGLCFTSIMVKLLLFLVLVIALSGCGGENRKGETIITDTPKTPVRESNESSATSSQLIGRWRETGNSFTSHLNQDLIVRDLQIKKFNEKGLSVKHSNF